MQKVATLSRATGPVTVKNFGPMRPRGRVSLPAPATPQQARVAPDFSDIPRPEGVPDDVVIVEGYRYTPKTNGVPQHYKETS